MYTKKFFIVNLIKFSQHFKLISKVHEKKVITH